LIVGIVIIICYFAFVIGETNNKSDNFRNNLSLAKFICFDRELIIAVQRDQIAQARQNIFGNFVKGNLNISNGDDLELYFHHFETLEVSVRNSGSNRFDLIAYYRIYKNANDNIRTLLYNFEVAKKNKFRSPRFHSCIADDCQHPKITKVQKPKLQYLAYFLHERKRFPFVFVRDPLQRLVSAITEIEYRATKAKKPNNISHVVQHPLGSQERFQDFINLLLLAGGSKRYLREQSRFELAHIAPQIGSIHLANLLEAPKQPLQVYRTESFNSEWKRLADDCGVRQLHLMYKKFGSRDLAPHASSKDPLQTSLAAKSFLSYASIDAYNMLYSHRNPSLDKDNSTGDDSVGRDSSAETERLGVPHGVTLEAHALRARAYLVAICRLYITDYICAGYALPKDCEFILQEVEQLVRAQKRTTPASSKDLLMRTLRAVLPVSWLNYMSSMYCISTPTPECMAEFTHGTVTDDDTGMHEEL